MQFSLFRGGGDSNPRVIRPPQVQVPVQFIPALNTFFGPVDSDYFPRVMSHSGDRPVFRPLRRGNRECCCRCSNRDEPSVVHGPNRGEPCDHLRRIGLPLCAYRAINSISLPRPCQMRLLWHTLWLSSRPFYGWVVARALSVVPATAPP